MIAGVFGPIVIHYLFLQLYTVQKIQHGYLWIKFRRREMADTLYALYCTRQFDIDAEEQEAAHRP